MLNSKNKLILILAALCALMLTWGYFMHLQRSIGEADYHQQILTQDKDRLQKLVELQKQDNQRKQMMISALIKESLHAKMAAAKALAELEAMKKPVEQGPIDGVADVLSAFKTHYGDSTVELLNDKFSIGRTTASLVLTDGVNWKLNAPIFKESLAKSEVAIGALKNEAATQEGLITQYKDANAGLTATLDLKEDLINNEQQQGKVLSAELSATKKRGRLEIAATALATFLATWAITK